LIDELADSGFDDVAIRGFLGDNFYRVANRAWQGNSQAG
jgi:microsomal dipeptidase-like Zn-dependent dipeptidase